MKNAFNQDYNTARTGFRAFIGSKPFTCILVALAIGLVVGLVLPHVL